MTKETIYYSRMFGYKEIDYCLETKTILSCDGKIITRYYAIFGTDKFEISKEEYDVLLKELGSS